MHSPHSFDAVKDVWLHGWLLCLFDGVKFGYGLFRVMHNSTFGLLSPKITEEGSFATIASDQPGLCWLWILLPSFRSNCQSSFSCVFHSVVLNKRHHPLRKLRSVWPELSGFWNLAKKRLWCFHVVGSWSRTKKQHIQQNRAGRTENMSPVRGGHVFVWRGKLADSERWTSQVYWLFLPMDSYGSGEYKLSKNGHKRWGATALFHFFCLASWQIWMNGLSGLMVSVKRTQRLNCGGSKETNHV